MTSREEYAAKVIERHRPAFELWEATSMLYRSALHVPRTRSNDVAMVLDMLMLQAYNSHTALSLLAEVGLIEDAATVARRLLEIAVQATYIAAEAEIAVRERRAGMFIAFMWRQLPSRIKHLLPAPVRAEWSAVAKKHGRFVPAKAKRWGPDFRAMFVACGAETLYQTDYKFLSGMSHGAPETHIMRFSEQSVRAYDDQHVSVILLYGSKYLAITGEHWNDVFNVVSAHDVTSLRDRLVRSKVAQRHRAPAT
jgi:hypothetical protein